MGAIILAAASPLGERVVTTIGDKLREETQDRILFTITFSPEPREQGVHVTAEVEGVEFANELVSRPPYLPFTWAPKGASASVWAQQLTPGKLTCTAHLNGKLVDGPNTRNEVGSVRCYVRRRPPVEPAVR